MTEQEKRVWHLIVERPINVNLLSDVLRRQESQPYYRITPSYRSTGGGGGGLPQSRVENFAVKKTHAEWQIQTLEEEIAVADKALQCPELNDRERALLEWAAAGGTVSGFAHAGELYISYAYKIRDRAVAKATKYITR